MDRDPGRLLLCKGIVRVLLYDRSVSRDPSEDTGRQGLTDHLRVVHVGGSRTIDVLLKLRR